jgi:hypothetical protein
LTVATEDANGRNDRTDRIGAWLDIGLSALAVAMPVLIVIELSGVAGERWTARIVAAEIARRN